jgi:hypothetical protein
MAILFVRSNNLIQNDKIRSLNKSNLFIEFNYQIYRKKKNVRRK